MKPPTPHATRRGWILTVAVLTLGAALLLAATMTSRQPATPSSAPPAPVTTGTRAAAPSQAPPDQPSLTPQQQTDLDQSIARMRAVGSVAPATSPRYPAVSVQARQQADLYAAAFVRQLLTQDYRTSRDQLLAWVQSESAQSSDPLVVGLTPPDLRSTMAVASVQDGVNGPAPVPNRGDWVDLGRRQGHTTVDIQRVTEPPSWAAAVAVGQVTDPGVTARQVDAEVTLHTLDHGKATTARYSVALVLNLEGPPVRDGYGFVTEVTYTAVRAG